MLLVGRPARRSVDDISLSLSVSLCLCLSVCACMLLLLLLPLPLRPTLLHCVQCVSYVRRELVTSSAIRRVDGRRLRDAMSTCACQPRCSVSRLTCSLDVSVVYSRFNLSTTCRLHEILSYASAQIRWCTGAHFVHTF